MRFNFSLVYLKSNNRDAVYVAVNCLWLMAECLYVFGNSKISLPNVFRPILVEFLGEGAPKNRALAVMIRL